MSTTNRMTPGQATAGVFYISALVLLIASIVLAIMACKEVFIVSGVMHFGIFLVSLFGCTLTAILASVADDGMFAWPKGGAVDPPPPALLPRIEWSRSGENTQIIFYVLSIVFGVYTLALMIASIVNHPAILFSTGFHFFAVVTSASIGWAFLKCGAAVEGMRKRNANAGEGTSVLMAFLMVVCFAIVSIAAANGHVLFFPEFAFGVCVLTLATAGGCLFHAGRVADRGKATQKNTSDYLFVIAGGLAAEAALAAIIAAKTVLFSAGFHTALVIVVLVMAAASALWAALLRDRDRSTS